MVASESYRALCSDMYINLKLAFRGDPGTSHQAVVDMFERLRRDFPEMCEMRQGDQELSLEADAAAERQCWVAVRPDCVRAGAVNPAAFEQAYELHQAVLEVAPYFLGLSALDFDYYEQLFGFDIDASGDHDRIVFDSLLRGSPLAALVEDTGWSPIDAQPVIGVRVAGKGLPRTAEAYFEVKTRPAACQGGARREPISVYLTIRRHGPMEDIATPKLELPDLARCAEGILASAVVPRLVQPIRLSVNGGA